MLGKVIGAKAEASLIRLFESGWFQLVDLTEAHLARMAVLIEQPLTRSGPPVCA